MRNKSILKRREQLKRENIKKFKRILITNLDEIGGAQKGDAEQIDMLFELIPHFKEFKTEVIKAVGEDGWKECLNYVRKYEK